VPGRSLNSAQASSNECDAETPSEKLIAGFALTHAISE
jgi:hypothetical protein